MYISVVLTFPVPGHSKPFHIFVSSFHFSMAQRQACTPTEHTREPLGKLLCPWPTDYWQWCEEQWSEKKANLFNQWHWNKWISTFRMKLHFLNFILCKNQLKKIKKLDEKQTITRKLRGNHLGHWNGRGFWISHQGTGNKEDPISGISSNSFCTMKERLSNEGTSYKWEKYLQNRHVMKRW